MNVRNSRVNIVDRPLSKGKGEVSLSAFAFLFSELVQYSQSRTNQVTELEKRLSDIGWTVGTRFIDLITYRERGAKRETRLVNVLSFIQTSVWKSLFGKPADSLEQSVDQKDQSVNSDTFGADMIIENEPLTNKFISVPKELGGLNCAAFMAGVVKGVLEAADLNPEKVTAHSVTADGQLPRTVILITFSGEE